ncbi:hypothetical protein ACLKOZ_18265 [Arthrobacter sp. R4]
MEFPGRGTLGGADLPGQDPITNIRSGRHDCFDRLMVDVNGEAPRYTVRYVRAVTQDGSGFTLPLRGGAFTT